MRRNAIGVAEAGAGVQRYREPLSRDDVKAGTGLHFEADVELRPVGEVERVRLSVSRDAPFTGQARHICELTLVVAGGEGTAELEREGALGPIPDEGTEARERRIRRLSGVDAGARADGDGAHDVVLDGSARESHGRAETEDAAQARCSAGDHRGRLRLRRLGLTDALVPSRRPPTDPTKSEARAETMRRASSSQFAAARYSAVRREVPLAE